MTSTNALIGLWAETSLHAGAGSSVDGIDLPIQRESHSGWPCVYGSAVKGALRAKAEDKLGKDKPSIKWVFGPDSDKENASEHAGALLVGDARLLLLPVRSLNSHFKWVTCPALLERLQRDATRLGIGLDFSLPQQPGKEQAMLPETAGEDLFLEEYRFKTQSSDLTALVRCLGNLSGIAEATLKQQLVIVHNDQFNYLSRYATAVAAHIAIDNERKMVKNGALWYEETLPPETVLYVALSAYRARDKQDGMPANAILNSITQDLLGPSPYLQLGGNETVGMGWCKVTVTQGREA
ncbi:type III-B CRISPR module RAMP protein Cmr4 [Methylomonas sp. DH-1]|uniref:type III-B CRISPR module RAMP protein Cmr4 n=1 Tax=Methylomonas sp. (strain DH-1) TaxID=1727196 RepID=UPI0007C88B78|nr:type III-B CRISPR module RAMP protein Cmr4 [Methylomonas sp. DH-1]ANE56538.1 type III-B CRISPR module RAMP protein Cmr4 [Methylomonas sp. DH-1]